MHLEFEKPIEELEHKIEEMKHLAHGSGVEVDKAVKALEIKLESLKKEIFENLTRWQRVQLARHPERPYTLDYIYEITDDFIEMHGDRMVKDDKAMIQSGRSRFSLVTLPASDFPSLDEISSISEFEIPQMMLKDIIEKTLLTNRIKHR